MSNEGVEGGPRGCRLKRLSMRAHVKESIQEPYARAATAPTSLLQPLERAYEAGGSPTRPFEALHPEQMADTGAAGPSSTQEELDPVALSANPDQIKALLASDPRFIARLINVSFERLQNYRRRRRLLPACCPEAKS
jgi:hypothetical protein